jgi:transposase-like protein
MGDHVSKKNGKRKRRSFSKEYKAEVVELCRTSGKSIGEISRELDLTETAVRDWVQKADAAEATAGSQNDRDLEAELRAAKKRIKELEMEREILKKAAAFFAKENS